MKKLTISLTLIVGLTDCQRIDKPAYQKNQKLVVTVVDYSRSYTNIKMDSASVARLLFSISKTGGTVVHIAINANSENQAVYVSRVERLDTVEVSSIKNVYRSAAATQKNKRTVAIYSRTLERQASRYMEETRKYTVAPYTDLQQGLHLVSKTTCEPLYSDMSHVDKYVLCLTDFLNNPPYKKRNVHLKPIDVCGATVLLVRPSSALTDDSLRKIFNGAKIHVFSSLEDAISYLNEN